MSEKLSCHVVEDLLPLYLDGVVSEATGQDIEEHLAGCPACAAKLEDLHAPAPELAGDDREDDAIRRAVKKVNRREKLKVIVSMSVILLAILAAAFILDNGNEVEIPNSAVTKESYLVEVDGRFFEVGHVTADERYSKLAFYVLPNKNDNDFWWTHISVCRPVFPFLYYNKEAYEDAHEWYYYVHVDSANGVSGINHTEPVQVQPADEYPDWVMEAFQALRETGINRGTPERIGLSGS
mgnify:FL=1